MACSSGGCSASCDGTCSGGCGKSCTGTCSGGCGKNCTGSCSGDCGSNCTGTCSGGCKGTCKGGCKDTCTGGCDGTCNDTCSGKCRGGCKGCGGDCSKDCTACTGTCKDNCDNGCTATSMTEIYEALGEDIILNSIVMASDFNDIQEAIIRELTRRGITVVSSETASVGNIVPSSIRQGIHDNCAAAGYQTSETTSTISAEQLQRYITFIKELYSKIVIE